MTLQEMLDIVDELSWHELETLQERINQRRQAERVERPAQPLTNEEAMRQIREILKDAEPVELVAGTMDVDVLERELAAIREELSPEDLDEIVQAMNEEYIEPDETHQ